MLFEREGIATVLLIVVHDDHEDCFATLLGHANQIDVPLGDGVGADGNHSLSELELGHVYLPDFDYARSRP